MRIWKEKDILEYFPTALYSMAMIVKSGGSLEKGFDFVARNDFGRVSLLCIDVLEVAIDETFLAGLEFIRYKSDNKFYQEAILVMIQYAKHGADIGDRLVALGNRMQTDAVMTKRNHYRRVKESLIPQTTMLLAGIGFLFIVIFLVLTRDWAMQEGGPLLSREDMNPMLICWLVVMAFVYPVWYRDHIFRNPAFVMPRLQELKQLFGNQNDMAISRFLTNTASYITMGWSLEMAVSNALPVQKTFGIHADTMFANRAMSTLADDSVSFDAALLSLGAWTNSRKFTLSCRFIAEAKNSQYSSLAETLKYLADTFWSSHLTVQYYQSDLLKPVVGSFALKFPFIFMLIIIFPALGPFLILALIFDSILLLFCMT